MTAIRIPRAPRVSATKPAAALGPRITRDRNGKEPHR